MIGRKPNFIDSPYFDDDTWTLKPGAPKELVQELEEYNKAADEWAENNRKGAESEQTKLFLRWGRLKHDCEQLRSINTSHQYDDDLLELEKEFKEVEEKLIATVKRE